MLTENLQLEHRERMAQHCSRGCCSMAAVGAVDVEQGMTDGSGAG